MKIGLVLSGGGGKGAYELGVWKALRELGLSKYISVFSGTSIGAFNSVLFAMDDMEKAEKLWEEVTMDKLVPLNKMELLKRGIGLYLGGKNLQLAKRFLSDKIEHGAISNEGAVDVIEKYLDCRIIDNSSKVCFAACTELPNYNVKYFKLNEYDEEIRKKIVLASASLPLIYDSTEVMGGRYIDGGIADNTPIQPVYGENCDVIIVVLLSKEANVDRGAYPHAKLIIISPENLEENTLNGTLNLDTDAKRLRISEGYRDTMNRFEPFIELVKFIRMKEEEENNPKLHNVYNTLKGYSNKIKSMLDR